MSDDSSLTLEDGLRAYRALLNAAYPVSLLRGGMAWIGVDMASGESENGFITPAEPDTRPVFPARAYNADNHRRDWAHLIHLRD